MLLAVPVPAEAEAPMYWRRRFRGTPDQVWFVRAFTAQLLADFDHLDDVLLVVDELAVNALRHTRSGQAGGHFTVELRRNVAGVVVHVTDEGGPGEPRVGDMLELAESGRGLLTVEALATAWSWKGDFDGRTVRAIFAESNS